MPLLKHNHMTKKLKSLTKWVCKIFQHQCSFDKLYCHPRVPSRQLNFVLNAVWWLIYFCTWELRNSLREPRCFVCMDGGIVIMYKRNEIFSKLKAETFREVLNMKIYTFSLAYTLHGYTLNRIQMVHYSYTNFVFNKLYKYMYNLSIR